MIRSGVNDCRRCAEMHHRWHPSTAKPQETKKSFQVSVQSSFFPRHPGVSSQPPSGVGFQHSDERLTGPTDNHNEFINRKTTEGCVRGRQCWRKFISKAI